MPPCRAATSRRPDATGSRPTFSTRRWARRTGRSPATTTRSTAGPTPSGSAARSGRASTGWSTGSGTGSPPGSSGRWRKPWTRTSARCSRGGRRSRSRSSTSGGVPTRSSRTPWSSSSPGTTTTAAAPRSRPPWPTSPPRRCCCPCCSRCSPRAIRGCPPSTPGLASSGRCWRRSIFPAGPGFRYRACLPAPVRRWTQGAARPCRNSLRSRRLPSRGTPTVPSDPTEPTGAAEQAGPRRRSFLRGMVGGVAGGVAGAASGSAYAAARPGPEAATNEAIAAGLLPPVPFHGQHQAGILPKSQRATAVVSLDATAESRGELTDLFQTITDRARFLTAGGTPPPVGINGPPSDSGVLAPPRGPAGLTVTLGVGSTLFDDRYGLAGQLPPGLTPMRSFPNDDLDPAQTGGDLILQLTAGNSDTVLHALRDIARHARGGMQANWRIDGFTSPARPTGTVPRNMLGFMDGIANPSVTSRSTMVSLVWVEPGAAGEPAWTANGSYFVVRLIRMFVEFWDRVDVGE